MLWFCLQKFGITSITYKYLEKDHTQNENDSIHGTIASASRNIKIYTTPQWATVIRAARRDHTYVVKEMSEQDFFYFKDLPLILKSLKLTLTVKKFYGTKLKVLQLSSENPYVLHYKTHRSGNLFQEDLFKRIRSSLPNPNDLPLEQLRDDGVPISKE